MRWRASGLEGKEGRIRYVIIRRIVSTSAQEPKGDKDVVSRVPESTATVQRTHIATYPAVLDWLQGELDALRLNYPKDNFEAVQKPNGWHLKCADCPGKLYTTGPNETLRNFSVHLQNRYHRRKVDERILASTKPHT